MKMVGSGIGLHVLLALRHNRSSCLTELAHAVEAPLSSVQRGLTLLAHDGLVIGEGDRKNRRYRLSDAPAVPHLIGLAITGEPLDKVLRIVARAHPAIEFLARGETEVTVVIAEREGALAEGDAAKALAEITDHVSGLKIRYLYHDDLRRELLIRPELRDGAASAMLIHGSLERSFPDRSRHGLAKGRELGRPHASLRLPSRPQLRRLAKRHRLDSLLLFGSATRSDFRTDSDVDVAIRFHPGVRPTLGALLEIEHELERATGRDVEVLREENLEPDVRDEVRKQAVELL